MPYVESLPNNSSSTSATTACATAHPKSLTDDGNLSSVMKAGGSSIDTNQCYGGSIATFNWPSINISGADITGVRFTVDANANVDDLSTAMQYQISINQGADFTSLAALDLTGAPIPNTGTTTQFHTTLSDTELHGLDWSGLSLADIRTGNQVIFRWYINDSESAGKVINSDYTKLRVYYGTGIHPKSLSINSLLTLNGKLTIK